MGTEHRSGIYEIRNDLTGKVYIGSAKRFNFRWNTHRSFLRKGTHHSQHLQAAWNKYGESAFSFNKLVICSIDNLIMYEQIMIDGHKSADRLHGYNARPIAESVLGFRHSVDSKLKMSLSQTGRKASAETRALLSRQRTGRKMPAWFSEFTRQHKTGTTHSAETRALIGLKGTGRKASTETVEKRSKLTLQEANEILARYKAGGVTQSALAKEFSLNQSTVSLLVREKRWSNFTQPL